MNGKNSLLWLIFKRELVPASDRIQQSGDKTPPKPGYQLLQNYIYKFMVFIYKLLVFHLPMVGIALLLLLLSYAGLCLIGAEETLKNRLQKFKTSPFAALFARGSFEPADLQQWTTVRIEDVFSGHPEMFAIQDVKTTSDTSLNPLFKQKQVFSNIKPFSWIYLDIENKEKQHLQFQQGMGLPLYGAEADEELIREIRDSIVKGKFPEQGNAGIIVSAEGMKLFGWDREPYPDVLRVKKSYTSPDPDPYIPLPLTVVKKLPYQFLSLIPIDQFYRLDYGYYYKKIDSFDILFQDQQSYVNEYERIKKALPPDSDISNPIPKGARVALRISLPQKYTRVELLEQFAAQMLLKPNMGFDLGTSDETNYPEHYRGAIFHLNFQLPKSFTWDKRHIYTIQNYMKEHNVDVEGEVIELLSVMLNAQENLRALQRFFGKGLWLISLMLVCFFAVILHTRMHRIGAIRMLGYPDGKIVLVFLCVGLVLVVLMFAVAVSILKFIYTPIEMENVGGTWSFMGLFGWILLITEVSFLLPFVYYLYALQPAEMLTHRS